MRDEHLSFYKTKDIMKKLLIFFLIVFNLYSCMSRNNNNEDVSDDKSMPETKITSEAGKNIDRYLSGMETLGFSGAIVVSKGDEILLIKGYGLANRETRRHYTSSTIQTCGSITKQFTAAAILLLESQGELSVDDTITKYFSRVPEDKKNITIHQLLTHSSGLPGGIGPDDEPIEVQDYVERTMSASLQFSPGSGYGYSNTGYSLLAMIIERVSGQSYETFLRKELLLPAGMTQTGYILPDWNRNQMATGYGKGERWGEVYKRGWLEDGPNWHLRGNGGIHTTVTDMHKWLTTVKGNGVLNKKVAKRWTTGYLTENNGYSEYGYGWVVYEHNRWGKIITHSGSNRIFEADFAWLTDKDFFYYIQGNTSMFPAANQGRDILKAAFDTSFVMPPIVQKNDSAKPETARQRAGIYRLKEGSLELTVDDTRLFAKLTGQSVLDLMFNHTDAQKLKFAQLNNRTRKAMDKLQNGRKDALAGMIAEGANAVEVTKPFLRRIDQIGNLDSLHVIGSFANTPGSRFYDSGPWTTFVYAEFAHWNQYWNLIWSEDKTFKENRRGPWPTFVLIPIGNGQYSGIRKGYPWNMKEVHFEDGCLIIGKKACYGNKTPCLTRE